MNVVAFTKIVNGARSLIPVSTATFVISNLRQGHHFTGLQRLSSVCQRGLDVVFLLRSLS